MEGAIFITLFVFWFAIIIRSAWVRGAKINFKMQIENCKGQSEKL
jgi:hypothetical protein